MTSTKNVLLTFDYELFQGKRSGSVENCMLRPTAKILSLLKKYEVTAIFFIDMLYLCQLKVVAKKHERAKKDFELIEKQLIEMAENGHYVFNHIHPHWLDAIYLEEKNDWTLEEDSKYSLESLTDAERERVFEMTMNLLKEILNKASRRFVADGYRAGGLYIQPFSIFGKYFKKHGIQNDFSVLISAIGKLENNNSHFDFSEIKKSVYNFSEDIAKEDNDGSYTEYTMRFVEIPFVYRLLNSIFYRLFFRNKNHQRFGDGVSTSNKIYSSENRRFTSTETFSVEMLNDIKLPLYIKELKHNNYLHLLSHPKLVSEYNLQLFEKLLGRLTAIEGVEFDYKKFNWRAE